ncbi:MAG: methyltransferase domain-containing protein [Gammaproteobacteria bacterium]|nr:methyltransferase domain-containing protein [Gammaproteobacteria bacterium]
MDELRTQENEGTAVLASLEKAASLVCPVCHSEFRSDSNQLICKSSTCGKSYPILDGIPILINESLSVFRIADYTSGGLSKPSQTRVQTLALAILPSLEINVAARANVKHIEAMLFERASRPKILNIGGKHPKAALARLRRDPRIDCLECDVIPNAQNHAVADPRSLPFNDGTFDAVFLDAILEHSVDPQAVVDEVHRVLNSEGIVYADTPFMLQVHGGAFDFMRFSDMGHKRLFARFRCISTGVSTGPASALGNSIQAFLLALLSNGRRSRFAVKAMCRIGLFWLKYFDYILAKRSGSRDCAQGVYFVGERSDIAVADRALLDDYIGSAPDLYARAQRRL